MASDDGAGPGLRRNKSWSRGREVSWDEMGSLGLHKALNEYYKMTTPKGCMVRHRSKGGSGGLLATLLCATVLHPLPCFLAPEALSAIARWAAYALAVAAVQSAVVTIPLALLLAASSFSSTPASLQVPPVLARALPGLWPAHVQLPALPPPPRVLAGLLAFLALLRTAERVVCAAASKKAARRACALRPEQLQRYYAGWEMPSSQVPEPSGRDEAPSEEESEVMQRLAQEAALVCERVYGDGSSPQDVGNYDDLVAFVLRLCNDAGVQVEGPSQQSPDALLELLQRAKHAIGIP